MTRTISMNKRNTALAAALLLTTGIMAVPALAQSTGGDTGGATGAAPSPAPSAGEGLTGSTYEGQVGETTDQLDRSTAVTTERPQMLGEVSPGTAGEYINASEEEVAAELQELGFTDVQDVSRSGDIFEATADWQGESVDLTIDGETGTIAYADTEDGASEIALPDDAAIPTKAAEEMDADYVREQLAAIGFTDIQEIEVDHQNRRGTQIPVFQTTARYDGEWVNMTIDSASGGIEVE